MMACVLISRACVLCSLRQKHPHSIKSSGWNTTKTTKDILPILRYRKCRIKHYFAENAFAYNFNANLIKKKKKTLYEHIFISISGLLSKIIANQKKYSTQKIQ